MKKIENPKEFMDDKDLKDIDADIFDFDNIPMSELEKAYMSHCSKT